MILILHFKTLPIITASIAENQQVLPTHRGNSSIEKNYPVPLAQLISSSTRASSFFKACPLEDDGPHMILRMLYCLETLACLVTNEGRNPHSDS